jgi:hypothetical protein
VSLFCLSSPCILCNQGCQCLCFVCLHPVSCVIKVASVFVLFVFTLYLVYSRLPVLFVLFVFTCILCNQGCQCYLFCLSSPCILCNQGCQCYLFYLSSPCILCNQGCQCYLFCCLHPVSCVIKVASVFVLFVCTLYLV